MGMPVRQRYLLTVALLLAAGLTTQFALGRRNEKASGTTELMADQHRAIHALNRLTFGPRPGDVQRVMQMGVDQWI